MIKKILIITLLLSTIVSGMLFANNKVDTCINNALKLSDNNKDQLFLDTCNLDVNDVPAVVDFLRKNPSYDELDLSDNNIGDEGVKLISAVDTLHSLVLNHDNITDVGVEYLMASKLVSLGLSHNNITEKGAILIAQNDNLSKLSIYDNYIGDEGAIALGKTHLSTLNVASNNISADGAIALAKNKELLSLVISYNPIGDKGISELLLLPKLADFEANHCAIGDAGISAVANNKVITHLEIALNLITDQGVFALANTASTQFENILIGYNGLMTEKGVATLDKRFGKIICYDDRFNAFCP